MCLFLEDTDGHLSWESQLLQEGVDRSAESLFINTHFNGQLLTVLGHLRGLLGDFDGEKSNDLRTPLDEILQPTSTSEEIYQNFGLQCKITVNYHSYFTFSITK